MKRGKYEEKALGPMFPRLHVNDTERGGPRAPPRNKMALYEQLTIPSNRHNSGNGHVNTNNGSNLVPNGSSSRGTSRERCMYFPVYQPPVAPPLPSHSADRLQRQSSNVVNLRSPASQAEQRRKPEDDDDFAVPIFSQPGKGQCNGAHQSNNDEKRCQAFSSCCSSHKEIDQLENANLRQDREGQVSSSDPTIKYSADMSALQSSDGALPLREDAPTSTHRDMNRASRPKYTNVDSGYSESNSCGPINKIEGTISLRIKSNSHLGPSKRNEFDSQDERNRRFDTLPRENRIKDVSQTSMVATISDLDVSPDDVADIIGLKGFWEARRAIVNQQRVFAVQVFELHRLIKVQKLIAKSPEILLEAGTFLGKSSTVATPLKKTSIEYAAKALEDSDKQKDDTKKPNHNNKMEDAAQSAVAKAPAACSPSPTQPSSQQPFPVNAGPGSHTTAIAPAPFVAPPVATDPKASPWPFPQGGGHQWLVPVMSPSEGLVYKPYPGPGSYPGPGLQGPVCGGCGPHGTTPLVGPFINPSYGVPPSHYYHHHQGVPFSVQGYFPPYGMPMMSPSMSGSAVDQANQLSGSNPNGETGQTVGRVPNFSIQQQGSCNIPSRRHSELIGSTASSPSDRAQDIVAAGPASIEKDALITASPASKEKDALTLFPSAALTGGATQSRDTEQPTMVIKVVPHNARTATESAARIFRSIQEERKRQHQSS